MTAASSFLQRNDLLLREELGLVLILEEDYCPVDITHGHEKKFCAVDSFDLKQPTTVSPTQCGHTYFHFNTTIKNFL